MRKSKVIALAASAVIAGFHVDAFAASATWVQTAAGTYSWVNDANWTAAHPDGSTQVATVGSNSSGYQLITLDSNSITVGTLNLSDTLTPFFGYNIGSGTLVPGAFAANTLVFDNGGTSALLSNNVPTNNVTSYISAPIVLNDNLSIVASTGAAGTFNLSGGISDGVNGSKNILATGTTTAGGTVIIAGVSNTYSGTTTIENGVMVVGGDIISGVAGPLGKATSAVAISTAISPAANIGLYFVAPGANVTNTISRPLDFSGSDTNASGTGSTQLQYVVPGGNTDVLNVTSGVTIGTKRATNFYTSRASGQINFTGLISSANSVSNGGPANNVNLNLGSSSGDSSLAAAVYRFANPSNNFSANITLNNGAVIVANGSVPGNFVQGTQNTAATSELSMDSPLGHAGSSNGGSISLTQGNGGNIVSTSALSATRSVFMETPNTYFGRNLTIGGGAATPGLSKYATNASNGIVSIINGFRFGGLNTTGEVNWRGDISANNVNVGGFNGSIPVATNLALFSATGGVVNFTGRISDPGTVVSNASTGQITSTVTRVTINGFRDNAYLDKNADGVPDSGGAAGTNANDVATTLAPIGGTGITAGVVRLNSPTQADYWAGTTEVMGGTLVVNNELGKGTSSVELFGGPYSIGDTVTVNAGATIAGYGTVRSGLAGSTLDIYGTINPSDPVATTLTVDTSGAITSQPTRTNSVFGSEKPINFKAGSNLTLDINSATVQSSGATVGPGQDQLVVGNGTILTSGTAITIDNTSLATTPLLNINLGYAPLNGTNYKIIDLQGTAGYSGTFAGLLNGNRVMLTQGSVFNTTYLGKTYFFTVSLNGGSGTDMGLSVAGPSAWKFDQDGDYNTAFYWDGGVPNIVNSTAIFGNVVTAQRAVSVNAFEAPTTVIFDTTNPGAGYNLTGTGSFGITTLNSNNGSSSIAVNISDSGSINVNNASSLVLSGRISGATKVVVNNTAHLTLGNPNASTILVAGNPNNSPASLASAGYANVYGGGTNVSGGQLTLAAPGAIPNFGGLTVGANALVNALDHGSLAKNNLFLSSLTLAFATGAWTGKVDLANNDLVVQNGTIATMNDQVKQGFNGGAWNGSGGIVSTNAAADASHLTALGVIENSVDGTTTGAVLYSAANAVPNAFDNATASAATDVLVKYTYYGDTNLDGVVDATDYSRIDSAFATGTSTGWFNGDFNYDGVVNGSDYTLIDNAFNRQGAQFTAQVATATAEIAGGSAVPEPTTLSLLGISAAGLLGRRRRRN